MAKAANHSRPEPPYVHESKPMQVVEVAKDWKEYIAEAILIVFSVLLALILTEVFNSYHEKQKTREILQQVRNELISNKGDEEEQYRYHLQVVKNIDSALKHPEIAQRFITNGVINFSSLAPQGVLLHDLNDVAWQVARQNNIVSKIDLKTYSLLTSIYDNQERFAQLEKYIAEVLLSRESRTASDNRITLILLHDNYRGWAVDRAPRLIKNYQRAINELSKID